MKVIVLLYLCVYLCSCSSSSDNGGGYSSVGGKQRKGVSYKSYEVGDLVGAFPGISYESERPYGSIFIPSGSFSFGLSDEDTYGGAYNLKDVSITALFVDETEVTNAKYRKFYKIIEDNIIREALALKVEELIESGIVLEQEGILEYSYIKQDTSLAYYKYVISNYSAEQSNKIVREIDYFIKLPVEPKDYPDKYYAEVLDGYFIFDELGQRVFDKEKLVYNYHSLLKGNGIKKNEENKLGKKKVKISPDEEVWVKDFSYSYNDPMALDYFKHFSFDDYPVVGVNWDQAVAFCAWRTEYKDIYNRKVGLLDVSDFRLPSEVEWEYVSRANHQSGVYPWGGKYLVDEKGNFLANFKPLRGDYVEDGFLYTSQVKSFKPNDYGIYDISGNVSEWTSTTYRLDNINFYSSLTPNYQNENDNRVVLRGGSWKDIGHFLKVFVRDYEFREEARSYIGFRTVQEYQGEKIGKIDLELYYDY